MHSTLSAHMCTYMSNSGVLRILRDQRRASLIIRLSWLANQLQRLSCHCPPSPTPHCSTTPSLSRESWGFNSDLHICIVSTLLTELACLLFLKHSVLPPGLKLVIFLPQPPAQAAVLVRCVESGSPIPAITVSQVTQEIHLE